LCCRICCFAAKTALNASMSCEQSSMLSGTWRERVGSGASCRTICRRVRGVSADAALAQGGCFELLVEARVRSSELRLSCGPTPPLPGGVAHILSASTGQLIATIDEPDTAKRFVKEGAYVFITGRRQAELDAAVSLIGKNVTAVQGEFLGSRILIISTKWCER
jgi:hypothetical protein